MKPNTTPRSGSANAQSANAQKYELLLAAVIAARATSFIFSKMLLRQMETFSLLAVRFLAAFALLLLLFLPKLKRLNRKTLGAGAAIGALYFCVTACELTALKSTASSTVSLLENCAIIIVPIMEALLGRRLPKRMTVVCALTAFAGVACLSLQNGELSAGMVFALAAALLYSAAIIMTDRFSRKSGEPVLIGIIQLGTMGALSLAASLAFESPALPKSPSAWAMLLVLIVVCSCFGFTLQPLAQQHVSSERTGVFCAINPAIAALLGIVVLNEPVGLFSVLGIALILLSILLPHAATISLKHSR